MKNLVVIVVIAALAIALYLWVWPAMQAQFRGQSAEERVEAWLSAQRAGDEQTALSQWAKGVPVLEMGEMRIYTGRYDDFRQELGILDEKLEDYDIVEVSPPQVKVRLNGRSYTLRVDPGSQITLD